MGTCPNCGEIVMEGDPYCSNCGTTFSWADDSQPSYEPSYSSGGYRPILDESERKKRRLESLKSTYEDSLKKAREEEKGELKLKYYEKTVEDAQKYWEESERCGLEVDGMPKMSKILSESDVDWISERHYNEETKLHIISRPEKEDLENILKATNNRARIRKNEEKHRQRHELAEKRRAVLDAIYSREGYFKHIEKGNDAALKNKFKKAVKEYGYAVRDYEKYFRSGYSSDMQRDKMPESKLTGEALDNIIAIYIKTHPLLTSKKSHNAINCEIVEMLDGEWDERLKAADLEVEEILHQRQLEKERIKEEIVDKAGDVIVGVRIAGDKIRGIFRK